MIYILKIDIRKVRSVLKPWRSLINQHTYERVLNRPKFVPWNFESTFLKQVNKFDCLKAEFRYLPASGVKFKSLAIKPLRVKIGIKSEKFMILNFLTIIKLNDNKICMQLLFDTLDCLWWSSNVSSEILNVSGSLIEFW